MRTWTKVSAWLSAALAAAAVAVAAVALAASPVMAAEGLTIVKDGASDYVIVVAKEASESEKFAAAELAAHLKQMSGAELKVETESDTVPAKAIIIGDGPAAKAAGVTIDAAKLGSDGYVVKAAGSKLVIAGGRVRGTLYGVYDLLAQLGCRWWAPGASTIPAMKTVTVAGDLCLEKVPVLEYRAVLYGDSEEPEFDLWMARNHLNGQWFNNKIPAKWGGNYAFDSLAHTFSKLVPPEEYFEKHPEYYAANKAGKRHTNQLCLSNAELVPVVAEAMMKIAAANPDFTHVTFGQDDNRGFCECDPCNALYEKYGAKSGAMLDFTNKVAAIIKPKYPKLWVNTMAYEWSRQPPKGIVPADNVMITFCSIECNFGVPLAEGFPEVNAEFVKDAEVWAKIAPRIFVWDYTTNFVAYVAPFPNYYSLAANVKFFVDHKVRGLFEQGSHTTNNAQFSKLCLWVEAQAMWNPEADGRKLVEEFVAGYYGPKAGPLVLEYMNMLHDKVVKDKLPVYATHRSFASAPYITPEIICRGEQLFEQAEVAVKDDAELLRRVQIAHLPVQNMILRRPTDFFAGAKKLCPDLTWAKLTEQFVTVGQAAKITAFREGDTAANFFGWATDYGQVMQKGGGADLPAELKDAPAGSYRLVHAGQLDGQARFMKKVEGATDGWAMGVITYGWSIQHKLGDTCDYTPGKSYKFFARARGQAKGEVKDPKEGGLEIGVHSESGPRLSMRIPIGDFDGQWRTYELGTWKQAPANTDRGPSIYICLNQKTEKSVENVFVDCIWWQEVAAESEPAAASAKAKPAAKDEAKPAEKPAAQK